MLETPLVFVSGFLGSSHCIGMCGPFALAIGSQTLGWKSNLRRQLVYSAGRVFTYSILGAMSGFCGLQLARKTPTLLNVPALFALLAGVLLCYQGLATAGMVRWRRSGPAGACLASTFFASFLQSPRPGQTFLAGLFTGLLPCGLVYSFLALAASTASMTQGAATMALFGCGTVPIMTMTGCGGALLSLTLRRQALRVAAWCVVLSGILSIARGVGYAQVADQPAASGQSAPGQSSPSGCPFCR